MNIVEPIRDNNKLEDILNYLKMTNTRNYLLFLLGLYTGLRVSDILQLQVKHVINKDHLRIKEKKTNKYKTIKLNRILKKELDNYVVDKNDYEYLIANSKSGLNPISRQ